MSDLALLLVPLVALAYLAAVGVGATVALAPRLPADAQAALSPVVGAALVASASVALPLGVPARPLAVGVGAAGVLAGVAWRTQALRALRAGALPLLVGVVAITLAAAPSIVRGDWRVASLYGSTDAYHWSSQARAYLDGPTQTPVAEHPDRLTYQRTLEQHWAVAVPFGVLQLAWVTGSDPPDVYGAFAALVFCLLPLVTFAAARGSVEWPRGLAAVAGIAVAANAALLFASHFSWQQQLAGSAFAVAGALVLRLALEPDAPRREPALAGLLAAAALATYRLGFSPYLAVLLGVVVLAYALRRRGELRRIAGVLGLFAAATAALAAPSFVALARGLPDFISSGGFSTAFKRAFPHGHVAEGLGLVPHVWTLLEGWPSAARNAWLAAGTVAAIGVLAAGMRAARRAAIPRGDFLAAGVGIALVGYAVLLSPSFSSYLSFKLLSYAAPFLVLLALTPFARAGAGTRFVAAAVGSALVVPSVVVATALAIDDLRTPGDLATLPEAALHVPAGSVIEVALDDPWQQAWAVYYLRERRLSVERPSFLFTGQGRTTDPRLFRNGPVAYVLDSEPRRGAVWRAGELALVRL